MKWKWVASIYVGGALLGMALVSYLSQEPPSRVSEFVVYGGGIVAGIIAANIWIDRKPT